jgi:hypothetical protein
VEKMMIGYRKYYIEKDIKSLNHAQVDIARKLGVPLKRWTIRKQVEMESMKWCEKNKWFGVDKDRTQYAFNIHDKLVRDFDISVNTKGYYKLVDAFVSYYNEVRKLKLTKEQIKLAKKIGIPITRLK